MSFDLFYDNCYADVRDPLYAKVDPQQMVSVRKEKFRLYRCVDRKGNFLWWEWAGSDTVESFNPNVFDNEGLDKPRYTLETESGYADFTPNGDQLELTQDQRDRALTRKVKL